VGPKGDKGDVGPRGPGGEPGVPGPPSFLLLGNFPDSNGGFFPPNGDQILLNEANTQVIVPTGSARSLRMRLSRLPGNGGRAVATVRRNGRDTVLRCRIDDVQIQCSSEQRVSVGFQAGDLLSVSYSEVNTPDTRVMILLEFVSAPELVAEPR